MGIEDLDSFEDVVDAVLTRANEETDGTSDWDSEARMLVVAHHRRLVNAYPWLCLEVYPPGRLLTSAGITTLTLTAASVGLAQTVTLSADPAGSILGWKIAPRGTDYAMRVTADNGSMPTVDVVPEVLAAGTACDLYQDEYDLAATFNLFVSGLYTRREDPIPVLDDERLRRASTIPAKRGWPAESAALIGPRKIRLSHWDTLRHPIEYPYTFDPGDPSGSSEMTIEGRLRVLLVEMALPDLLDLKRGFGEADKKRIAVFGQGGMLDEAKDVDRRRRRGGEFARHQREQADDNPWG